MYLKLTMDKSQYIISTLAEHPDYFNDVIKLIDNEFRYSEPFSFATDFAPLVHPHNFANSFIAIEQSSQNVVAHLGTLPRILIKNKSELPILMIGGIVTEKEHRNKNIFKELMQHAFSVHQNNIALVFLWSELNDIYEKFSFYRAGGIIETGKGVITSDKTPEGFIKTKFSQLSEEEFSEIKNLYRTFNERYFFTLKRSSLDWSIIHEMNSIDLFIKKSETDGKVESYFCYGKGKDLTCIIHELSTSKENYEELISTLASFKTWLPETEMKFFINKDVLYSSFVKILNRNLLNNFLYTYTGSELTLLTFEGELEFTFKGSNYKLSEKEFTEGLLGPNPLAEFVEFGLSPYFTGTDSI